MVALLLALVATMTPFVADPDRAHAQSQSQDTTLSALSFTEQTGGTPTASAFMPAFVPGGAPDAGGYTVYAATGETDVALSATSSHSLATVTVKAGEDEDSATDVTDTDTANSNIFSATIGSPQFQGAGEDTVILVTVTAADNVATATYKLTVKTGDTGDDVTTLSALSLMAGGEDVTIAGTATAGEFTATDCVSAGTCTALVPYATTSVAVTATTTDEDDGATYAVTSDKDDDVQNGVVDLAEGENVITVTGTGADKVTTNAVGTYTVTVTRAASNLSADATLHVLTLTYDHDGVPANDDLVQSVPGFASGRTPASSGYTVRVASTVEDVVVTATASFRNVTGVEATLGADEDTATDIADTETSNNHEYLSGDVDLSDEGQDTVIRITVTAGDGISDATYMVTVVRAAASTSTISTLSGLSLMAGGDEVAFAETLALDTPSTAYTASVPNATRSVTVMATPTNRGASYVVTSDKDSSVRGGVVDLSGGANVITVKVTAAAGPATSDTTDDCADTSPDENIDCYTITVTRALSTTSRDTALSALSITQQTADPVTVSAFMPAFVPDSAPASGGYTVYVATGLSAVGLTATTSHSGATVTAKVGPDEDDAADADDATDTDAANNALAANIATTAGDDVVVLVTVTAADGFAKATYKLTLTTGGTGDNVRTLSALSLEDADGNGVTIADGDATAGFTVANCLTTAIGTTPCTASVPNATTMVEVTATPTDDDATYAVTSDKDSSVQNNQVDLAEGANVITVTVTGADKVSTGAEGTYAVTVTRVASNLSTDTTLSELIVADSSGTLKLEPEFVANRTPEEGGYATKVSASTIAEVTVTATTAHSGASIEVRAGADYDSAMNADAISGSSPYTVNAAAGFQGEGADTVILVTVTAADLATTGTHMITVSRDAADENAQLKSISLNGDAVTFTEDAVNGANARVIVDVPSVTVMAAPRNSMATVTVTSDKDSDVEDNVVDLEMGINVITITVDPVDATTENNTYTIRVRRDASTDATLSSLSLKHLPMDMMEGMAIDLSPMFDSGTMAYSANAGDAEKITVTAMATHAMAEVSVTVGGAAAMMTDVATYWDMLGCPAMNDAVGADDQPDDETSPYCKMYAGLDDDAKAVVDAAFANYYDVPLSMGSNMIAVMVTAEDGTTTETYNITVTAEATSEEARLLAEYDTNGTPGIQLGEAVAAAQDYSMGTITLDEVVIVIRLYATGGGQ